MTHPLINEQNHEKAIAKLLGKLTSRYSFADYYALEETLTISPPIVPRLVGSEPCLGGIVIEVRPPTGRLYTLDLSHSGDSRFNIHITDHTGSPFTRLSVVTEFGSLDVRLYGCVRIL